MQKDGKSQLLRAMVRGTYDVQKLRIQTGNRLVQNIKVKLGQEPGEGEDKLDDESKEILAALRAKNKLLGDTVSEVKVEDEKASSADADKVLKLLTSAFGSIMDKRSKLPTPKSFKAHPVISDYTELSLVAQYVDLKKHEETHFRRLKHVLGEFPIWNEFMLGVKGIGEAMAGVIVSEIDIHKARYPSSLWAYAGLDVAGNGAGRSRKKEHLVDVEYKDKEGKAATRKSITFNPFLKTKLVGVLAGSFLKIGPDRSPYAKVYYDYKHRLENHPKWVDRTKAHRHNAAMRYMIKMFLIDLYNAWRRLEGLPVAPTYQEAKLGKKHGKEDGGTSAAA